MFNYYLQLGLISLKRNPVLTALMVLGIALGIAASMTSLTLLHIMGSDPIPWKSDRLHYVQLDNWDPNQPYDQEGNPPDQVSYRDAQGLMEASKADKQAAMFKVAYPIQPENPEVKPFLALGRATYSDFFPMFEPPFQYGNGWDHAQDHEHARVVVLSKDTNEKLFGGQNSVGKTVRMNFASSRPTVLIRQTSRNANDRPTCTSTSFGTTFWFSSHSVTLYRRLFSGRGKRPSFFCSLT